MSKQHNSKRESTPSSATKNTSQQQGKRFKEFVEVAENQTIKAEIKRWHDHVAAAGKVVQTVSGNLHRVIPVTESKDGQDCRFTIPKSRNFDKSKDGSGLASMLQGTSIQSDKMTFTWVVAALQDNPLKFTAQQGWENFECSHRCCDYDENGKRMKGFRCIDPACLVFESKAANQERANPLCHMKCKCGCGVTLCECHKVHDPPCR